MAVALISMGINIILTLLSTFKYSANPFSLITEASKLQENLPIKSIVITAILVVIAFNSSILIFKRREFDA
jgi:multisubunit Na+/H+ antiporter MnhC subunit